MNTITIPDPREWSAPHDVKISDIENLMLAGYEVEVDSPDGWVGVNDYVYKGYFEEYVLITENNKKVYCNENHRFETLRGWVRAIDFDIEGEIVQTIDGPERAICKKTARQVNIVDISVDHVNQRYYTNGVSSHNTGIGKSLVMCHLAAAYLAAGLNVLYISMEMAEERLAERIDANLMDIDIADVDQLNETRFNSLIDKVKRKAAGKLIFKEYPTASAHVGHFRALVDELKLKKEFIPDVIFIDYLNICASSRLKAGTDSYSYVKSIAEELRGFACELEIPIWSATQTNRSGYNNSDVELADTSESYGLPSTCDLMLALISNEELEDAGQIMIKQLKNRYNDPNKHRRFIVGIDKSRMRLFDVHLNEDDDNLMPEVDQFTSTPTSDFGDFQYD